MRSDRPQLDERGGGEQCEAHDEACAETFVPRSKWDIGMGLVVIARHACVVEAAGEAKALINEPELARVQARDGPEEDEPKREEQCSRQERGAISPSHEACCCITLRSPADDFSKARRKRAAQLHLRATKRDGFLGHRG